MFDNECNRGVKCTVESCAHYESGDHCDKDKITVNACCNAVSSSDKTMCESFLPKE